MPSGRTYSGATVTRDAAVAVVVASSALNVPDSPAFAASVAQRVSAPAIPTPGAGAKFLVLTNASFPLVGDGTRFAPVWSIWKQYSRRAVSHPPLLRAVHATGPPVARPMLPLSAMACDVQSRHVE